MELSIDQQKNGRVTIDVTASADDIAEIKDNALAKLGERLEIEGFRKGKAPAKMVEKRVKTQALVEEILNLLINQAYLEAIAKHNLSPITNPDVTIPALQQEIQPDGLNFLLDGLGFSIKTFVTPKIELGNWKKAIRGTEAKSEIETAKTLDEAKEKAQTPKDVGATRESPAGKDDDPTQKIFDTLAEEVKIEIPEELIEREVNHRLYHQAQAVAQTGMSLEDYLKSQGDNLDDYREKLGIGAENHLKVKFILPKIAKELGIKLEKQEDFEYTIEKLKKIARGVEE